MRWFIALLYLFLTACSGLPNPMRSEPYTHINFNEVKKDIPAYKGMPFRWGGVIINITNKENTSQAQLLFYPLNRYGRPRVVREAKGRFAIARSQFLDPAIFKEGTEVTVTGILTKEIIQKIGKRTLVLPQLDINHIHIWPKRQDYNNRFYHYPYSPYYYYPSRYYRHSYFHYDF